MKVSYQIAVSLSLILIVVTMNSMTILYSGGGTCYDQVGDGHPCFEKENKCEGVQKYDDITETPCYVEDQKTFP